MNLDQLVLGANASIFVLKLRGILTAAKENSNIIQSNIICNHSNVLFTDVSLSELWPWILLPF